MRQKFQKEKIVKEIARYYQQQTDLRKVALHFQISKANRREKIFMCVLALSHSVVKKKEARN